MRHAPTDDGPARHRVSRRALLRGGAAAGTAFVAAGVATPAAGQEDDGATDGGWLDGVSNFDGTDDRRGEDRVTVAVGAEGNGGNFAFDPPAVRVDPGTTVVWEWTGRGSVHNVVAADGRFESDLTDEAGFTFERTIDAEGVLRYACGPHQGMGMRGVVAVGDAEVGSGTGAGDDAGDGGDPGDGDDAGAGGGGGGESDVEAGGDANEGADATAEGRTAPGLADLLVLAGGVGLVGSLLGMFVRGVRSP